MNGIDHFASLFNKLEGGKICDIQKVENAIQFRVHHPEKADLYVEGSSFFLCRLSQVRNFSLQPFRNATTTISDFKQIEQLDLQIAKAESSGELLKVWCRMGKGAAEARLSIQAADFQVWDEAFDPI